MSEHFQVLVIGGGCAGLTVAARLRNVAPELSLGLVEPSDKHYYQPLWTLVGGGVFPKEASEREEAELIPQGVTWVRDAASEIDPESGSVTLEGGTRLTYDYLIVAAGIEVLWDAIPGLAGHVGRDGICSNYSYGTVDSTWEYIRGFSGGTAVFTQPATPIKCAGAPQKICYLADDHFRRVGVRDRSEVVFATAMPGIFAVDKYARALRGVIERKGIDARYRTHLIEVKPDDRVAVFENLETGEETSVEYDMLHVTPPMGPPEFLRHSPLAGPGGWVEVHKHTLRHLRFPNVFSLGDCSSLPTSKTGAAIRKQAPVLVANLLAVVRGEALNASYDGYASCPLVTGYGKLILAEFDYDLAPRETFPFDQSLERYSMYALKTHGLPNMYWHGMLKGRV